MMDQKITRTIELKANITNLQNSLKTIQNEINNLSFGKKFQSEITSMANTLSNSLNSILVNTDQKSLSLIDANKVSKEFETIENKYRQMIQKIESEGISNKGLIADADTLKQIINLENSANSEITRSNKSRITQLSTIEELEKKINELKANSFNGKTEIDYLKEEGIQITNNISLTQRLNQLNSELNNKKKNLTNDNTKNLQDIQNEIDQMKKLTAEYDRQQNYKNADNRGNLRGYDSHAKSQGYDMALVQEAKKLDSTQVENIKLQYQQLEQELEKISVLEQEIVKIQNLQKTTVIEDNIKDYRKWNDQLAKTQEKLKSLGARNELTGNQLAQLKSQFDFSSFGIDPNTITNTQELQNALNQISTNLISKTIPAQTRYANAVNQGKASLENINLTLSTNNALLEKQNERANDIKQLQSYIQYYFSLYGAIRLVSQAIRETYETVKELDEAMTETAVVTDFTVSDMWDQLPEYTEIAKELGVAIQDVYEASTLFYQQGLETNQVMALTVETLKMARIAGLDAATATDRELDHAA